MGILDFLRGKKEEEATPLETPPAEPGAEKANEFTESSPAEPADRDEEEVQKGQAVA